MIAFKFVRLNVQMRNKPIRMVGFLSIDQGQSMNDEIIQQIEHAIKSGKMIHAIKLLRKIEDLNLLEAKERIDLMRDYMRDGQTANPFMKAKQQAENNKSSTTRAHSHKPARSNTYNVEGDLPTEAFLFFQRGEVSKGIEVLQNTRGVNKSTAKRMAKMFFQQHPEYTSQEIFRLIGSGAKERDYSLLSTENSKPDIKIDTLSKSKKKNKRKRKAGVFEFIFFIIIFFNIVKACST